MARLSVRRAILVALAFGAVCRIAQYAANVSLWHDESFVALIVRSVPFHALLGPLDWNEPSPPGFLALEQAAVAAGGESELSLRAVPLLAALAGLLAVAALAWRGCLDRRGALFTVVLAAGSDDLIAAAAQVKHFSFDLLIAALLVGLAWRAWRLDPPRAAPLLLWGAVGAVGLWLSYAAAFVVAGSGTVLGLSVLRRGDGTGRAAGGVALGAIAASAAVLLVAVLAQRSPTVVEFWSAQFPPRSGVLPLIEWLGRALLAMFDHVWRPLGGLLIAPAALAAAAWWRSDRRPLLLMLWLPVGWSLLAAALGWWPFGGTQHMAFAAPAMLLLAGDGIELARRRLLVRRPRLVWAGLVLLLAPGLLAATWHLVVPRQRHAMREAIGFMQARLQPDDRLAVFDVATFAFYTGRDLRGAPPVLSPTARVWVITPTSSRGDVNPAVRDVLAQLTAQRPRLAEQVRHGGAVYLFGVPARLEPSPAGRGQGEGIE